MGKKEFACPEGVYFPSEDSFLLSQSARIRDGQTAIDVGCGSGIQSLGLLLGGAAKVIALDINEEALAATEANCRAAGFGGKIEARKSDLFAACPEKADIVVFNPPYVETRGGKTRKNDGARNSHGANGMAKFPDLDGGAKGREVLDRFLAQVPAHLNEGGVCYFLQTDLNGYAQTGKILEGLGLEFEVVGRKRIFFEELAVFRAKKSR